MTQEKGVILLTTILMITLLSMLVVSLLQMVFLYVKTSAALIEKHKAFYRAEASAHRLFTKQHFLKNASCKTDESDPNRVLSLLRKKQGCVFQDNDYSYHYFFEDRGVYSNLCINAGDTQLSTHHWQLSMVQDSPQLSLIQIRMALPENSEPCTLKEQTIIPPGIISWRYVENTFASHNTFS